MSEKGPLLDGRTAKRPSCFHGRLLAHVASAHQSFLTLTALHCGLGRAFVVAGLPMRDVTLPEGCRREVPGLVTAV